MAEVPPGGRDLHGEMAEVPAGGRDLHADSASQVACAAAA